MSGLALSHLHYVLSRDDVPHSLLRERLALRAAEACVIHVGRPARARELRDAMAFLQLGDEPGPAGEVYLACRRAVEMQVSAKSLRRALADLEPDQIAEWLDAGKSAPVLRSAAVLEAVLGDHPRAFTSALLLADAALAQSLAWSHVLPLLALGLKRSDLRKTGEELRLACHRATGTAAAEVTRGAADLARRAARLKEVAPKLRAKGSDEAVAHFLARDSIAPTALTSLRSDRAARRFCDRLVELGVARHVPQHGFEADRRRAARDPAHHTRQAVWGVGDQHHTRRMSVP